MARGRDGRYIWNRGKGRDYEEKKHREGTEGKEQKWIGKGMEEEGKG